MKKLLKIFVEITYETFCSFTYFVKNNLMAFANILNLIIPYAMYFIGQYVALDKNKIAVGYEVLIPIVSIILIYYIKSTVNKLGKGTTIPVPNKRFTQVDKDGEVSIENGRIQEVILYLADLEDWMERKGML